MTLSFHDLLDNVISLVIGWVMLCFGDSRWLRNGFESILRNGQNVNYIKLHLDHCTPKIISKILCNSHCTPKNGIRMISLGTKHAIMVL